MARNVFGGIAMSVVNNSVKLTKSTPVTLRDAGVTEGWLEEVIEKDPGILGLGEVIVRDKQRRQEKAGRLDLLLEDDSEEQRYEVELMLGATDESHLIRTIEYWDIERRKWPGYDHCAVLVAEDITHRFLNVISLFSGSVPIVAIQVNAFKVDDKLVLNFVRVLDSRKLRTDDLTEVRARDADRQYWISKASADTLEVADKCLAIINKIAKSQRTLNYKKRFIGLHDGIRSGNFVTFKPRRSLLRIKFESLSNVEQWKKRLDDSGLEVNDRNEQIRIMLPPKDFEERRGLLTEMLEAAVREYEKD
jgi:hypothetical protein